MTSHAEAQRLARRTHARQPRDTATDRAQAEASAPEANGTNRHAGAGAPPARAARNAHTSPEPESQRCCLARGRRLMGWIEIAAPVGSQTVVFQRASGFRD
ncbi:MAG: hypothetical protein ACREYE_03860 [Gammaproteobacteria bacterium]